jgi:tetraacyldisaccharide 4'-kinase
LLLDGVRAWDNGRVLPFGDLREPMASAKRAHALVVTRGSRAKVDQIESWWSKYGSGGPVFYIDFKICALRNAATGERLVLPAKPGPLFAFCALGHPEAFYADLLIAGLPWVDTRSFRDHQRISVGQMSDMASSAMDVDAVGLACTEKDAVKLTPTHLEASALPIWIAEQEVVGAEKLADWIVSSLFPSRH